jgi:protein farnesyltransferase/geranylgeranyltransferase type-1 subunit alpha
VLETFKLWDGEFAFIEEMLKQDPRNNSAWNQRFFVVTRTTGWEAEGVRAREIEFAFKYMSTAPNNQSPWNYLKGYDTVRS